MARQAQRPKRKSPFTLEGGLGQSLELMGRIICFHSRIKCRRNVKKIFS